MEHNVAFTLLKTKKKKKKIVLLPSYRGTFRNTSFIHALHNGIFQNSNKHPNVPKSDGLSQNPDATKMVDD